jgi:hypothetical protein
MQIEKWLDKDRTVIGRGGHKFQGEKGKAETGHRRKKSEI